MVNTKHEMPYNGRYPIFNPGAIKTYPIKTRRNKVHLSDLITPEAVLASKQADLVIASAVAPVAKAIAVAHHNGWPVILFSGAHVLKNGFGPLIVDWIKRGIITLYAVNTAGTIHDFELALIGETSENVPDVLSRGEFGMAHEFAYINEAIKEGYKRGLGYGESLGMMITNPDFQTAALARSANDSLPLAFAHPEVSVLAAAVQTNTPLTVHAIIGGDVIDQHPSFDGAAKGGVSGIDFHIFVEHVRGLSKGGVFINMGSAVIGPEVFLKSVSMVSNVGDAPSSDLVTADFDIRPQYAQAMMDERHFAYYYRDQKSVVTRIPQAFGGRGYYVQGDQVTTLPELYRQVMREI